MLHPDPLLLIPGLNCTERAFVPLLPALWEQTTVTLVNHRRGDTMADIAAAILAQAPPRFALLGFSMGGYIAFEILRQAPARVSRLCCLATMARPDTAEQADNRGRVMALAAGGKFDSVAGANFPNTVHPDNVDDVALRSAHLTMARDTGAQTYIAQQRAILARTDSRPLLPTLAIPTAVIVGSADQVTGVDGARQIAEAVPGARLTLIEGAGHLVPLEKPAETATAILDWLRS
ncbi:alpha/beta hydrolase [Devosia sp. SD17-2]|uniref:alpha/beta fold hydrolase n=1 Tax=Devosia sp. SD17-2 TaxID=2976459 RepID=UPI0023D7DB65|nr:alpha/beta hydrolase [Devosia sp. SD17-2]WEJ33308.1 alpha/beta hydrolase [Devosia sp. SD17-2]